MKFWTVDAPLIPCGYFQVSLSQNRGTYIGQILDELPAGATVLRVNVEGGSLRYCDSDIATGTYGELYSAGSTIIVTLQDFGAVSLSTPDAGTKVNLSFYKVNR